MRSPSYLLRIEQPNLKLKFKFKLFIKNLLIMMQLLSKILTLKVLAQIYQEFLLISITLINLFLLIIKTILN